jgi:hypothetical protein
MRLLFVRVAGMDGVVPFSRLLYRVFSGLDCFYPGQLCTCFAFAGGIGLD